MSTCRGILSALFATPCRVMQQLIVSTNETIPTLVTSYQSLTIFLCQAFSPRIILFNVYPGLQPGLNYAGPSGLKQQCQTRPSCRGILSAPLTAHLVTAKSSRYRPRLQTLIINNYFAPFVIICNVLLFMQIHFYARLSALASYYSMCTQAFSLG